MLTHMIINANAIRDQSQDRFISYPPLRLNSASSGWRPSWQCHRLHQPAQSADKENESFLWKKMTNFLSPDSGKWESMPNVQTLWILEQQTQKPFSMELAY